MEHGIYAITNTNFLTLDGYQTEYRVLEGCAYLFLVQKLENGTTGARNEVACYKKGEVCPGLAGTDEYAFILTGTEGTKVEAVEAKDAAHSEQLQNEILIDYETGLAWEKLRSVKRQKLSDYAFSHSLENISSVMSSHESEEESYKADDPLIVKVFKIVSHFTGGMSVRTVAGVEYTPDGTGLQLLAKDSDMRVREVLLRGKWYKEDNGHLVAFYNKDGNIDRFAEDSDKKPDERESLVPVALIRKKANTRYTIINPQSGEKLNVTKQVAARIFPMAFMVYRKIPDETIDIKKICKFVFADIRRDIVRFIVIGVLCTLIGLITPLITRNFIDNVIPMAAKNQAVQICVLVFVCNISAMIGSIAKYYASLRMETKADSDLEAAVMDRLLKLPVGFFKRYSAGDLAARAGAIPAIRKRIFNIVLSCFMNFVFSFVYMAQAYRFCPYFAKWGILFCIFPILFSSVTSLATYNMEKSLVDCQGKIQGMLLQFLTGIEKISNTNSEKRAFEQWSSEYIRQTKISYRLGIIGIGTSVVNLIYPTVVSIMFYYLFGSAIKDGTIEGFTTGTFMAFLSAYGSFQGAFLGIAGSLLEIRDLIPLSKRIRPIIEEKPEAEESKPPVEKLKGSIEVSHLNFRYSPDSPLVLKDVSMKIEPGQFVAVVGNSGAGKTTLLRLLLGFEHPESGSIFYDNHDINSIDIGSLRRQLGVVLQNDSVLQGTILQNIVGSSGLKEADAWEAAHKVAFDKDIEEMPMGMFTMIPAGGMTLSGGQLQRLIIARAIIKNPRILIFDEATSALDNLTQQTVRKSLDELNVTRVIIAHRLSTVINADNIYVMKDGEVIESGNYESLMAADGYFAQLAKRQI
ncbi:MAG: NHLP bacteriocin export ABC transporter permease/ATPase subunit [Spirochaetaceae bacterium]|nr:NHLP bacteriocin export ABC transporter permease/ATPase subunit [Spirochaetaceae bacterium]